MTDEKESGFKVADRRRYNPDGSLREPLAEEPIPEEPTATSESVAAAELEVANTEAVAAHPFGETHTAGNAAEPETTGNTDNVVSFPGATNKPPTEEEKPEGDKPKSAAAKATAASAVSASQAASQQAAQATQSAQQAAIENAYNQASGPANPRLPQASFLSLLNMLGVEAAMHLGLMEMQDGQRTPVDLEAARHMIDMIGMLKEKTSGNLKSDEEALLENVLADLRMQFVALSRKG
ncbi:MAG: DUF1844 domain-containing protein [Acidobacteria bacterium]|nr:DUF1844 domain-containing protein [Acidobacteriota bacterium]